MTSTRRVLWLAGVTMLAVQTSPGRATAQDGPLPPPRAIPGITAPDQFPHACVSCHIVLPDGMDVRISTLMRLWMAGADTALLAKAQSAAPAGLRLTGRHPDASAALADIPAGCLMCHGRNSTMAPSFARMLHRIHLTGGEANHFLTMMQGECTHCHKLDPMTGAWSMPSGPEP